MMDIVPTVTRLTGAKPSRNPVDGIDIWPLLSGEKPSLEREALLYFDGWNLQCARLGKYKLHVARYSAPPYVPVASRPNIPLRPPELYDLELDPDESYDLAAENPQVVADIRSRADRLLEGFPDPVKQAWKETQARGTAPTPAAQYPRPQP